MSAKARADATQNASFKESTIFRLAKPASTGIMANSIANVIPNMMTTWKIHK